MKSYYLDLKYKTKEYYDIIDFTDKIIEFVKEKDIVNGIVNIQLMHTSCALILNENEPLLLEDIKKTLEVTASSKAEYSHDNFEIRTVNMCDDECKNGHSHCKAVRLLPVISLNVRNGELVLGKWQRTMLIELDFSRDREIMVQVLGN